MIGRIALRHRAAPRPPALDERLHLLAGHRRHLHISSFFQIVEAAEDEVERLVSNIKSFSKNTGLGGFYNEMISREVDALESTE